MKRLLFVMSVLAALAIARPSASAFAGGAGPGIGTCPNPGAPDADGDGIPNGQDPDYVAPRDGSGRAALMNAFRYGRFGWLAAIGGWGPGDGTGNGGVGPGDGTGYGPGDGTCGDGPKGFMRRGGWR